MRIPCLGAVALAIATAVTPGVAPAQTRAADSTAIVQLVERQKEAMRAHRAEAQREHYASDAIWLNAFGRRRVGVDSIVAFLTGLYADPGYADSRMLREDPPEVTFIRPDVAVVHEYHEREGQRLADGTVIDRRVHTTFVVSREGGRWLIRYQHIADERARPAGR